VHSDSAPIAPRACGRSCASFWRQRWTGSTGAKGSAFKGPESPCNHKGTTRTMKKIALAIASLTAAAAPAFGMESFNDRARVIAVHPVLERIPVAREECWNDVQRGYEERRVTRSDT